MLHFVQEVVQLQTCSAKFQIMWKPWKLYKKSWQLESSLNLMLAKLRV